MKREPVPAPSSGPDPYGLLERRFAQQSALARFAESALRATAVEPLLAEATALVDQVLDAPVSGEDEIAFAQSVAGMLEAAVGKLRAAESSLHAALHDPLTGLANRSLILDRLELALARAGRRHTLAAVIFFDLDGFKQVNDRYGHAAGDKLLVGLAERLRPVIRPADTLGRWGGDEFIVVCEDLQRASDVPAIAERVAAAFDDPFEVHDRALHITASIGVAISGGPDDEPATLIHTADSAMYRAKQHHPADGGKRREPPVFPAGLGAPKLERLTTRLLDLLDSLEVDDRATPRTPA